MAKAKEELSVCSNLFIPFSALEICFYSFIHSGYFYSASSSPLLLRGAPDYSIDTVAELTS